MAEWRFDPNHSLVEVRASHMGIATLQAVFTGMKADIHIDEEDITKSWFVATIDAASIDVRYDRATQMFKSEAHLDAERYPEITFRTTRIEPRGKRYAVFGDLELHGVKKEVCWDATYNGEAIDYFGNPVRGHSLSMVLRPEDFGVNSAGSPTVTVNLEIEATKREEGVEQTGRGGSGGRPH